MPGDYFFLNYGVQDGNVMQGLFRVNKMTYQLEVYNGSQWVVVNVEGDATATPLTTVQRMAYAPASGALIWDVDEELLYVGDGLTTGGVPFGSAAVSMTSAARTAITPRAGMLIWDTTMANLFIGDGVTPGGINTSTSVVRGATNGTFIEDGLIEVNVGTVEEVLTGNTAYDMVDSYNLRGALDFAQINDVSCAPYTDTGTITYNEGDDFLKGFTVAMVANTKVGYYDTTTHKFPKFAPNREYLMIADVTGTGSITPNGGSSITLSSTPQRVAIIITASDNGYFSSTASATVNISNWRQYAISGISDNSVAFLSSITECSEPDNYFRSTSSDLINQKYLIKQNSVSPWMKTLTMSRNAASMTVAAGNSYKIQYTDDSSHSVTVDTFPADAYGWDAHIQMFVKGASSVNFQEPLVLMQALRSNAGHNLTVKFRNGQAFVYVDDYDAGYVVTVGSGTGDGTLYKAINDGTEEYVVFGADLDGTVVDGGTVTFVGGGTVTAINILGNGSDKTTITGNIGVNASRTMNLQNLTVDGGTIGGAGTMNLDDGAIADSTLSGSGYVRFNGTEVLVGSTVTNAMSSGHFKPNNVILNGHIYSTQGIQPDNNSVIDGTGTGSITFAPNTQFNLMQRTGIKISNITIKDCVTNSYSFVYSPYSGEAELNNVTITGNTAANNPVFQLGIYNLSDKLTSMTYLTMRNCTITGNVQTNGSPGSDYASRVAVLSRCGNLTIDSCTFDINQEVWASTDSDSEAQTNRITIMGSNVFKSRIHNHRSSASDTSERYLHVTIEPNTTINMTGNPLITSVEATTIVSGDGLTLICADGSSAYMDACKTYKALSTNAALVADSVLNISQSNANPWRATNITFPSPLDATSTDIIKLSGNTFTTTAKILNACRIQLPNGSTNSFQGNTNTENAKIFDAGLIVVGDNPASPSGSATIINAAGTSSTVSGIGTYIDKEGDNDFTAITNITAVTTNAASGTGSLNDALTASNKFIKIAQGTVGTVGSTEVAAVDKNIITHDYEPILGGTFSLTSATIDEATKTTTIQSGGTMTIVDVRGGKDSVIDLGYNSQTQTGGTRIDIPSSTTAIASGVKITHGFYGSGGGAACYINAGATLTLNNCCVQDNFTTDPNQRGCVIIGQNATLNLKGSTVTENYANTAKRDLRFSQNGTANIADSVIGNCTFYTTGEIILSGTVRETDIINLAPSGSMTLTSGATLDLTGNANATTIHPGGTITFANGGATVLYSSGAVSGSYMMDNVTLLAGAKLTNTAVVDLGGGTGTRAQCLGSASGISIISGMFRTSNGGFTSNVTVFNGGTLALPSGTSAFDSIVSSGGYCYVGGEASRATVYSRGGVAVNSGGVANAFTVSSGGSMTVSSGGTANEPIINSSGTLTVNSGGSALLVTSNTGATITVAEGGYITYKS